MQPAAQPAPQSAPPQASASAAQIGDSLKKQIFDLVKKGDVSEVVRLVSETGIDIANLLEDAKNFLQTPVFFAAINPDHDTALKMVEVLVGYGVNPIKEDLLK